MELVTEALELMNKTSETSSLSLRKNELSIYQGEVVDDICIGLNIIKLKQAFPKLPKAWFDLLEEFILQEQFTNHRLNDAVNNLIKTCIYPEPTVANLLSYDKKIKFYTYNDILDILHAGLINPFKNFTLVEYNNTNVYVRTVDYNPVLFKKLELRKMK